MGLKNQALKGKRGKGSVEVQNNNGSIRLRWRANGRRYSLSPGFRHDELGLKAVQKLVYQIELDILSGNFDPSLEKYRPQPVATPVEKQEKPRFVYAVDLYRAFLEAKPPKQRTYTWHYKPVLRMLEKSNPKIQDLKAWMEKIDSLKPRSWNDRLFYLKQGIQWAVDEGLIESDSGLLGLENRTISRIPDPTRKPLTTKEIEAILEAIKTDRFVKKSSRYKHSHYYGYIAFQIYTGCRPSEVIGLQWKHVNFEKREIEISTVLARGENGLTSSKHRIRKETKTGMIRYLPMNGELFELLSSLYKQQGKEELVFPSPTGLCLDDKNVSRRVWKPVLEALEIEYRVPYACRHGFISRGIEQGIPLTGIAYLAGHKDT